MWNNYVKSANRKKRLNTLTYVGVGMYSRVEVVISYNQVF